MKVILVNGSPRAKGCTNRALDEVEAALTEAGVKCERFWIGAKELGGCKSCGWCAAHGKCVLDDKVNEFTALADEADGFVFGAPVYYASIAGQMRAFLDRAFYSSGSHPDRFWMKPAAGVSSSRRAGGVATYDQFNKYFGIAGMPIVSASYWNEVHGNTPEEVEQDAEGLRTMRVIGRNMAYLLKAKEAAAAAGVEVPGRLAGPSTNFIR